MFPNAPSWKAKNKNNQKWLKSHHQMIKLNALIKERNKLKLKKPTTSKLNHPLTKKKFQEVDVHSWEDLKKRETPICFSQPQVLMNHSFLNSTTIFQPTKSTFHFWRKRKANQSQDQDKYSTIIQFIFNIHCSSTEKTTRRFEASNAAPDSCHMKNSEKRETNISTRVNMPRR